MNTEGQLYDAAMVGADIDRTYDSQAEVKVRKLDDRFVYELRLPLAPMAGDVSPGKVWGIYALRAVFGENVVENGNFSDRDEKKKNPAD